jgi:glutamate/tyrosine decarboxylase-like PLP-dependent enzyme
MSSTVPQNSRGFRALKVWSTLKHVGAVGYRNMIAEDIRLSQAMAQAVSRHAELQLMTQELSITTVPSNLRARLQQSEVESRRSLRQAVTGSNPSTVVRNNRCIYCLLNRACTPIFQCNLPSSRVQTHNRLISLNSSVRRLVCASHRRKRRLLIGLRVSSFIL